MVAPAPWPRGRRRAAAGRRPDAAAGTARGRRRPRRPRRRGAEEPHQPHDERADVEHAQPDHEDPARQRHARREIYLCGSLAASGSTPRRARARRTARSCTGRPPTGPARVVASIAIHSPSGRRSRWIPSSTLMNTHSVQSRTWEMPLAASAITSMRSSGEGSSPATSGTRSRVQRRRRAGLVELAVDEAPVERGVVGDGLGPERRAASSRPTRAGEGAGRARRARAGARAPRCAAATRSGASARRRSARRRASPRSARRCARGAACAWSTRWGASGIGRRMSKASRPTWPGVTAPARSTARASSAAGGPACWKRLSHGPRVRPVGTKRGPSCSYREEGRAVMSGPG